MFEEALVALRVGMRAPLERSEVAFGDTTSGCSPFESRAERVRMGRSSCLWFCRSEPPREAFRRPGIAKEETDGRAKWFQEQW